jgi:hypothetical protein
VTTGHSHAAPAKISSQHQRQFILCGTRDNVTRRRSLRTSISTAKGNKYQDSLIKERRNAEEKLRKELKPREILILIHLLSQIAEFKFRRIAKTYALAAYRPRDERVLTQRQALNY